MTNSFSTRLKTIITVLAISIITLTGCAPAVSIANLDTENSLPAISSINEATTIELKKAPISFGDSWKVKVNGTEIAKIKGEALYMIGDTYSMYSNDGDFLGAETENFKILNSTADIYDHEGNVTGKISQRILNLLHVFSLSDAEGNTAATLNQDFALNLKGKIKNSEGESVWSFEKKFLSFGASVKIEKLQESNVSAMDAIWMIAAVNEIDEAKNKKH